MYSYKFLILSSIFGFFPPFFSSTRIVLIKVVVVVVVTREAKIIDNEIKTLLNKGVIEEAQPSQHQVISSIFLRKKKNGSYRMILNRKRLNESIEYKYFKMERLSSAVQLMRKNCCKASVDLTDTS